MNEPCVALLGRRDEPTDAIEEYCRYLAAALEPRGFALELVRVPWKEIGLRAALGQLDERARAWRGRWVFLQYTALGWSRRGYPLGALRVMKLLKKRGARCAVVFHDAGQYPGRRFVDRLRRFLQLRVMRQSLRLAELAILTIPAENMPWLPANARQTVFIPVGANLPAPESAWTAKKEAARSVAVFSVTGGAARQSEVKAIVTTAREAAERAGGFRLVVFGRGAEEAGPFIQDGLRGSSVEVLVKGLLSSEEVVRQFGACDVSLFLRGGISTRRGSAIAGIACGLPVIASEGEETGGPVLEAGVVLKPPGAWEEFGTALASILSDEGYRQELAARSRKAQELHFSWKAIGARYAAAMRKQPAMQ